MGENSDDDDCLRSLVLEEDDNEDFNILAPLLLFAAAGIDEEATRKRGKIGYVRDRLEWDHLNMLLLEEGQHSFSRLYSRMEYQSFKKLCGIVDPFLKQEDLSSIRTCIGQVTTEIGLHCLLRWLAGGSYLDIRLSAGISIASFYRCIYKCIHAVLSAEELGYSAMPPDVHVTSIQGNSLMRDIVVENMSRRALSRPHYNTERNRDC